MEKSEKENKENLLEENKENIKNCIFKLKIRVENGKPVSKTGTGFICNISGIKAFITNNKILNQEFLDNEKRLIIYDYKDDQKEINLELDRYKYTNEEIDFTVIEIIEEDNIKNYLEIDELSNSTNHKNKAICSFQFQDGNELQCSHGEIIDLKDDCFLYSVEPLGDSSGAPILLENSNKIIGLYRAEHNDNKNYGIPINIIFNKINFIKAIYTIKKKILEKKF